MTTAPPSTPKTVSRAVDYVRELARRREFIVALGLGNLKARNANTTLGLAWWVLNPLLLGGVYFLVFGIIFGSRRPEGFLTYLLTGIFVFHFTSQAMTGGANSIIQNARLLSNLRFPRLLLPISALLESTVGFLVSLGVLLTIALATGHGELTYRIIYLPAVLIIHLAFNLGLGALTARLAVPFRDINNLIPYINRIWLYLSPIIWPLSFLDSAPATMRTIIEVNPMFSIIGLYRSVLLGTPVHAQHLIAGSIWSVAVLIVGVGLFARYEGHMVRYL